MATASFESLGLRWSTSEVQLFSGAGIVADSVPRTNWPRRGELEPFST